MVGVAAASDVRIGTSPCRSYSPPRVSPTHLDSGGGPAAPLLAAEAGCRGVRRATFFFIALGCGGGGARGDGAAPGAGARRPRASGARHQLHRSTPKRRRASRRTTTAATHHLHHAAAEAAGGCPAARHVAQPRRGARRSRRRRSSGRHRRSRPVVLEFAERLVTLPSADGRAAVSGTGSSLVSSVATATPLSPTAPPAGP